MNSLPAHRQIITGRTFGRPWSAADADPIRHYRRALFGIERHPCRPRGSTALIRGALVAVAIAVALGWLITRG